MIRQNWEQQHPNKDKMFQVVPVKNFYILPNISLHCKLIFSRFFLKRPMQKGMEFSLHLGVFWEFLTRNLTWPQNPVSKLQYVYQSQRILYIKKHFDQFVSHLTFFFILKIRINREKKNKSGGQKSPVLEVIRSTFKFTRYATNWMKCSTQNEGTTSNINVKYMCSIILQDQLEPDEKKFPKVRVP